MQNFLLSNPIVLLYTFGVVVSLLGSCAIAILAMKIFEEVMFRKIKNEVQRNPGAGSDDGSGTFVYKEGRFTIEYELVDANERTGRAKVKITAMKRRLWGYEEKISRTKKAIRSFLVYRKWAFFLKPLTLCLVLSGVALMYLTLFESEESKTQRIKWVVARALKISPDAVSVAPNGGVVVYGERKLKGEVQREEVSYNFNLADWLTFHDAGFVSRNTGSQTPTVTYPVDYYGSGNFRMNKDGQWIEGQYVGGQVRWARPQGEAGIQSEQINGGDVYRPPGKVLVEDK